MQKNEWRQDIDIDQEQFYEDDSNQIDLMELLSYLFSKIGWILMAVILFAALTFGYTKMFVDPTYTATGKLYIVGNTETDVNLSDIQISNYLAKDYEEVVYTHEVLSQTIANLGLPYSLGEFRNMITVRNPPNTRIIEITARTENATEAPQIVNELMAVVTDYITEVMLTVKPNPLSRPVVPTIPAGPSAMRNTVLGAALGGFLSVLILGATFLLDDKLKTPDDIQKYAGLSTLAIIPTSEVTQRSLDRNEKTPAKAKKVKR